jgi:methyl-accepting chemotaxis protein
MVSLFVVGAALVLWQQWRFQSEMVRFMAEEDAQAYSEALATFRTVYTANVVNTVKKHGLEVTHDFDQKENAIPLPATLTKILAHEIGQQGSGIKASLYSKYPFPWRGRIGEFPDKFAEEAWNALTRDPKKAFQREEILDGKSFLRYATADVMRQACVECHNTHPESPKTDWREGDVRGVLEVSLPLEPIKAQQRSGLWQLATILGVLALLGGLGVVLAVGRTRNATELDILNRSSHELSELVRGIEAQTPKLTSSSEELSSVSQQLSASAEETSTQANLVSTAADQISRHVEMVAASCREMENNSKDVARQAAEAASVATDGVRMALATNTSVAKLGESSGSIGSVVKAIASIAEQTNLLALNATIEAARAGEAGKGFAVVANEVKELAKQTAKATEEIGQRIGTIQQDISAAVSTIGQVGAIIHRISSLQTGIASAVEEQTAATRDIGRNISEASQGTTVIARNITGVADAARKTSEGAERTLRAAGSTARAALELKELVQRRREILLDSPEKDS